MAEFEEQRGSDTPPQDSDRAGQAGGAEPSIEAEPQTDPELKDYGPPADADAESEPDAGSSGAEEGLSPWAPESYSDEPEGPTAATD